LNKRHGESATTAVRMYFGKDGAFVSRPKTIVINSDSWNARSIHAEDLGVIVMTIRLDAR
jgi:hypothetical protein